MIAIGDEGRAADGVSHLDAKDGHRLFAQKAGDGCHRYRPEIRHRPGMNEAHDGFIAGQKGAQSHDEHNHQAGEVFKAIEAVGEPLGGPSAGQGKGHP